jgi:hypothetical protein
MATMGAVTDFCLEALNTGVESTCEDKYQSYQTDPDGTTWCPATTPDPFAF